MARKLRTAKWSFSKGINNIKTAVNELPTNAKSYIWEIPLAIATYILPASMLQLKSWGGFATSVVLTWTTGAFLGSKTIRDFAIGFGGLHLTYSLASDYIAKTTGKPVWRMGDYVVTKINNIESQGSDIQGLKGMRGFVNEPRAIQPNTKIIDLPNGYQATARPALEGMSSYIEDKTKKDKPSTENDIQLTQPKEIMPIEEATKEGIHGLKYVEGNKSKRVFGVGTDNKKRIAI